MTILDNKRILVTGGTGSLGHHVVRRILSGELGQPARVIVFSRDEAKQHYMRLNFMRRNTATDEVIYDNFRQLLTFLIGDVRDYASLARACHDADVVIHAAALKQVPTCEYFPTEAMMTNIMGASNLVRVIRETQNDVEAVVGISTDKACHPVNVMGMSKALMERVLIEGNLFSRKARFLNVRYGNVIASRGSVVPLFLRQIADGVPITITHEGMTRFLLTLDQAVDVIFAALSTGQAGETYVPRAPAARMVDVVTALLDGRDLPIQVVGIRPGEKLHEVMLSDEESHYTVARGNYYVLQSMLPELGGQPLGAERPLLGEYSSQQVTLDVAGLRELLREHVEVALASEHAGA